VKRAIALALIGGALAPACSAASDVRPDCRGEDDAVMILAAQAVPTATLLPCLDGLLAGWRFEDAQVDNGDFRFWLSSDRAGIRAVEVELREACDVSNAVEVPPSPDEAGTRRFEVPLTLSPTFAWNRFYTFPGGCVRVDYRFGLERGSTLVLEADLAIGFRPRLPLVDQVADHGLVLCGAGAPPCPGGD
jgi:hypothetical protein